MPRPYPPEFRARAVALVRVGKQAKQTAVELGPRHVVEVVATGRRRQRAATGNTVERVR